MLQQSKRMPLVEIYQFGGSDGSYAGDCCLVCIEGTPPTWIVIDLGTSTNTDDAGKTQFQRAEAIRARKKAGEVTLVITHWHADHTGGDRHGEYVKRLAATRHASTFRLADLAGGSEALRAESAKNGSVLLAIDRGDFQITVTLIYPDFEKVLAKKSPDENMCSLGALLTISRRGKPVFTFLTMGDMDPINEHQALAVVGKTPINVLKFPHHGSCNNYFRELFPRILAGGGTHVIVSGYTNGDPRSLQWLSDQGARSVTMLVQDSMKAAGLVSWAGFENLVKRSEGRMRAWKDAAISFDDRTGAAIMTGATWARPRFFGDVAALGALATIALDGGTGPAGGIPDDDGWVGWEDLHGDLMFRETHIIGVRYDDCAFVLVPTDPDGECFYRCCARYALGDAGQFAALRARLAASLAGPAQARVATPGEFADFSDIEAMANLLGVPIVVHLSEMADEQSVNRQRTFNEGSHEIPLHVLFEYNPLDGRGHISTLRRVE